MLHAEPALTLITKTLLSENDSIEVIENYHLFESVLRQRNENADAEGFHVRADLRYSEISLETLIKHVINDFTLANVSGMKFCFIHRPQTCRLTNFKQEFEKLLLFLKTLNKKTILYGNFDTLVESTEKRNSLDFFRLLYS